MVEYVENINYTNEKRIIPMIGLPKWLKLPKHQSEDSAKSNDDITRQSEDIATTRDNVPHQSIDSATTKDGVVFQSNVTATNKNDTVKTIVVTTVATILATIAATVVTNSFGYFFNTKLEIAQLTSSVNAFSNTVEKVNELDKSIAVMENNFNNKFDNINEKIDELKDTVNKSSAEPVSYTIVNPNENFLELISLNFRGDATQNFAIDAIPPSFSKDTIIGTDKAGNDLSFGELEGVPFCTYYIEDGVETWFYGELNEKGNWDGFCIMNDYIDDKLVALFESRYVNGIREGSYKSVAHEGDQFILSNRVYHGSFNSGETFICESLQWPEGNFKSEKPIRYNDCLPDKLISYYSGRTANGKYNDKTGSAFSIEYNEDTTVRIFYQGHFVNGNYVDDRPFIAENSTANNTAFWIILANDKSQYLYYMGPFSNGHPEKEDWHEEKNAKIPTNEDPSNKLPNRSDYPELSWKTWSSHT